MTITDKQTALALKEALANIERARINLDEATDDSVLARANEYEAARESALPVFAKAQAEYEGRPFDPNPPQAGESARPQQSGEELPPQEASPGVALVQPPGVVVDAASLDRFGPLVQVRSKLDPAVEIEATPYCFAEGTAVETGTAAGQVGIAQPSRIIRNGSELGVTPNDVFLGNYEQVPEEPPGSEVQPTPPPPEGEGADQAQAPQQPPIDPSQGSHT